MGSFSFPKDQRLLNRYAFVKLNRSGKRHHTEHFIIIHKENGLGIARLGVTVSRKAGNAVRRNRTKRLIREFFRLESPNFPQGHDIVIVAKKDASYLDLWKIKEEIGRIVFEKAIFV